MTPGRRRQVVDNLRGTWKGSIRRTCSVLQAELSSYHYKSRRPDRAALKTWVKEIAETRALWLSACPRPVAMSRLRSPRRPLHIPPHDCHA
jgi:putative transposase